MDYKKLEEINKRLETIDIKGKDYVEVNTRILAFRELYPDGSIETELIHMQDGICTFKAVVRDNDKIISTGHAQEKESSSFINKTSYLENCETSAVGRALGMLGIGATKSIASAEEVLNAINNQNEKKEINEINIEAKLGFGKHSELTWVQVYFTYPEYFDWLIENAKNKDGAETYRKIRDTIASREGEIKKEKGVE